MVSAVTCAVERITDGNIWFWLEADRCPLFSEGAGTSIHPRKCQRILNTNQKLSNIILQEYGDSGCKLEFKSSILQALYLENFKQSQIDQMVLEDFSKIMEAILLDSMWPGTDPVKRVHVCWGPALSFFYCTDFCYLNTWEILLMASVNTFYNIFGRYTSQLLSRSSQVYDRF